MMTKGRPKIVYSEQALLLKKTSLSKYNDVIQMYKNQYIDYLIYEETPNRNIVAAIKAFQRIAEWKQNWYIVYLFHNKNFNELCENTQTKKEDVKQLIKQIKKQIKTNL